MAGGLVDVCLEERSQFSFLVHARLGGRNLDLEKYMVRSMNSLRPLFTALTKIIVWTVTTETQLTSIKSTF